MYGALWRVLPGPWWVRLIILLVLLAAVLAALAPRRAQAQAAGPIPTESRQMVLVVKIGRAHV